MYARYAPSGHIVYSTADGGLFAIPFDDDALETRGTAIPIVAGVVRGDRGVAHFALSGNGTLLYRAGSAAGDYSVEWVDRSGKAQVIDTTLRARSMTWRCPGMGVAWPSPSLTVASITSGRRSWIKVRWGNSRWRARQFCAGVDLRW